MSTFTFTHTASLLLRRLTHLVRALDLEAQRMKEARRQERDLMRLDERMLADIGLTRVDGPVNTLRRR